jgi:hypothetical protein
MKPTNKIETSIVDGLHEYFIPEVRREELPRWKMLDTEKNVYHEPFDKDKTVWRPWISDTPGSLAGALKADLGYWRAHRFVKDPEDMRQVQATLALYFPRLKEIFINMMSSDNYPHVGWNDFREFCRIT